MELYQLQSFLRVADEGSITRAAEALCLTQPAVTGHVRALEREMGVDLFERTSRGVRLTPAGEALRQYGRQCLALLDECSQVIRGLAGGTSGRLVLGTGVTTSIYQLPGWLREFRREQPGVDVVVRTGRSREVASLALEREIDLGLITSPVSHPDLELVELFEEEIRLVAHRGDPLARGEVSLSTLEEAPLILFARGSGFRDYLDRALATAGITARVKMESDSVEAIKSLVMVGLGVSFLPDSAVREELESGILAPVQVSGLSALRRQTAAVYRRDRPMSASARRFLDLLRPDASTFPGVG